MRFQLNGLLCALVLTFAVGCGKENKSGSNKYNYPNLFNSGLTIGNQQVLDKNLNWYRGNVEGIPTAGVITVVKTQYSYNTAPTCETKKFLGIPFQYCTYDSDRDSSELSRQNVSIVPSNAAINTKGNAELNAIFSGASGTLMSAVDQTHTRSKLDFIRNDGIIVSYIIDRSVHSSLNPIIKIETSQSSKVETVTTYTNQVTF